MANCDAAASKHTPMVRIALLLRGLHCTAAAVRVDEMDPKDLLALSKLLDEALDLPDDAARKRWMATLTPPHDTLRPKLEKLLAASADTGLDRGPELTDLLASTAGQQGPAAGDRVGRYRLLRPLGRGGMAVVWLAEAADSDDRTLVALKFPAVSLDRGSFMERFAREQRFLSALHHPGIARLVDAGVGDAGQHFPCSLDYVDGLLLDTYCDTHGLGLRARIGLMLQVLEAVGHAHAQSILHRDLKPSNILVDRDGRPRLLDFGIAKLLVDGSAQETELTQALGRPMTLYYASPEQVVGDSVIAASDGSIRWGWSCIAWRAAEARTPPTGTRESDSRRSCCRRTCCHPARRAAMTPPWPAPRAAAMRFPGHWPATWTPSSLRPCARVLPSATRRYPTWPPNWRAGLPASRCRARWHAGASGPGSCGSPGGLGPLSRPHCLLVLSLGFDVRQWRRRRRSRGLAHAGVAGAARRRAGHVRSRRPSATLRRGQSARRRSVAAIAGAHPGRQPCRRGRGYRNRRTGIRVVARGLLARAGRPRGVGPRHRRLRRRQGASNASRGARRDRHRRPWRWGLALLIADGSDGVVRWLRRVVATTEGEMPTLAEALVLGLRPPVAGDSPQALRSLRYLRVERLELPASLVLADGFDWHDRIRGRVVILGGRYDAADVHPTPLGLLHGAEILAYTVETELAGRAHPSPRPPVLLAIAAVDMTVVVFLLRRYRRRFALPAGLAAGLLLAAGLAFTGLFPTWSYALLVAAAVAASAALPGRRLPPVD